MWKTLGTTIVVAYATALEATLMIQATVSETSRAVKRAADEVAAA